MKSRMNSTMGLKLLCVTDKRDTLVALSQKSENLSRLKTKAPWINFCGAFAISKDLLDWQLFTASAQSNA
jgi:hypothetical protein